MVMPNKPAIPKPFMPMLDLFQQLRDAGLKLTIEQYEWLRQALATDVVLEDWEDLRDICRPLWVRPSLNFDGKVFDREFDRYRDQYQKLYQEQCDRLHQKKGGKSGIGNQELDKLPTIPVRRGLPEKVREKEEKPLGLSSAPTHRLGMGAVKYGQAPTLPNTEFIVQVPIRAATIQKNAANYPRSLSPLPEFDLDATVDRIGREGMYCDEVYRPQRQKKVDFLLLVDDSNAMRPFAPVIEPFIEMVEQRKRAQTLIYRFNQYPSDYLYHQQRPLWGLPLGQVFGNLDKQRTVAIIISEAGAASPVYRQERVDGVSAFLEKLLPAVREVVWINPLPSQRWLNTSAAPIAAALAGRMVFLEPANWQWLTRLREFRAGVQLSALRVAEQDLADED
jgi:uncharacterized protein